MILLNIDNMSCGHCQIKIKAELEQNGFVINKFDMLKNNVYIDSDYNNLHQIIKLLDQINYSVNEDETLELCQFTVWNSQLDNDQELDNFFNYLKDSSIEVNGFDEQDFGVIILCSEEQYILVQEYLTSI